VTGSERILGIIPARAGSKRLPGKNHRPFLGKPLIWWTINAALTSKYLDMTVVSTDDPVIARVSEESGAKVPFIRPSALSGDASKTFDVVSHAIKFLAERGEEFKYVALLQPTSPLRSSGDVDRAVELLRMRSADCVVSVTLCSHGPDHSFEASENLCLENLFSRLRKYEVGKKPQKRYQLNGAIYLFDIEKATAQGSIFFRGKCYGYEMPPNVSIDIDNERDFLMAEALGRGKLG